MRFWREIEYFLFMKNILMAILGFIREGMMVLRERWVTWVKIKDMPKCLSPTELIQNLKFKSNGKEFQKKKEGKNQGVTTSIDAPLMNIRSFSNLRWTYYNMKCGFVSTPSLYAYHTLSISWKKIIHNSYYYQFIKTS